MTTICMLQFELFIDALPVWGYVGEVQEDDQLMHTGMP